MIRFMRIIVMFDLPTKTKQERKIYSEFRRFLLSDGYVMMQYSVYYRICRGLDGVFKHEKRLSYSLPENGAVRMMVITEKQYEDMKILVGKKAKYEENSSIQQLSIF